MYDWKDDVLRAAEKIESAIYSIESARESIFTESKEAKILSSVLDQLQGSFSSSQRLLRQSPYED